ncbi:hypothetical protein [Amycolatopsis sp. NPDC051071]|uniref:hypothetical protein n=1 Tax=Amycolatopsis sp. NPDC051071 TaxID=3154637 RepID=UPI003415C0D6
MRADQPIGALLFLWPTLWALWISTTGQAVTVDRRGNNHVGMALFVGLLAGHAW